MRAARLQALSCPRPPAPAPVRRRGRRSPAICRSIVEQHNGCIWAQSTVGAGSTLSFVLPAVQEQPPGRSSKGARYERSVEA